MTQDKLLDEKINHAAQLIEASDFVVAFTGAGISTPSGIPDFRSPGSGLWKNVDAMAVASIFGFRQNPRAFFDWVRPLAELMARAKPNPAHYALVQLEKWNKLHTIITQNIDMLHERAGNHEPTFELHGHLRDATCIHCFAVYSGEESLQKFLESNEIPRCEKCNHVLKPNVILFGEQLPVRELQGAKDAARKSDLMIIVGSSLEVVPASELPVLAHRTGAKLIIINETPTALDSIAEVVLHADAAKVLPAIIERLEKLR